jgi:membrane protease YdiL (CAAX protease family)
MYRGFLIEELGELLRNRWIAGVFSVLAFGLAHGYTFGWSLALLNPGLFGLVITLLYFRRSNLPIGILAHIGFDALHAFSHAP